MAKASISAAPAASKPVKEPFVLGHFQLGEEAEYALRDLGEAMDGVAMAFACASPDGGEVLEDQIAAIFRTFARMTRYIGSDLPFRSANETRQ